jgi:hypothetical protein
VYKHNYACHVNLAKHPRGKDFTGGLGSKRKHELVEIAEALNISDPEAKLPELKDKIQNYLNTNETSLSNVPQFKGLYGRKRAQVVPFVWRSGV